MFPGETTHGWGTMGSTGNGFFVYLAPRENNFRVYAVTFKSRVARVRVTIMGRSFFECSATTEKAVEMVPGFCAVSLSKEKAVIGYTRALVIGVTFDLLNVE